MKKVISIICIWCMLSAPSAYASKRINEVKCPEGLKSTSTNGVNNYHLHNHCYEDVDTDTNTWRAERKNPVGVGVDFYLYKSEKFDIENQNKFDTRNDEYSNFTVVKVKTEKGILQHILGTHAKRGRGPLR